MSRKGSETQEEYFGLPENFPVDMSTDTDWNRELVPVDKAAVLMKIFMKIHPCIEKCIFTEYGTTKYEMLQNYYYIYHQCRCIIIRHIQGGLKYPPSAFSAAVHQYVVHNRLYKEFKWRVVSAFFEYAALQLTDEIYREGERPTEEHHKRAVWTIVKWLWPSHYEERHRDVEKSVEQAQREQAEAANIMGWRLFEERHHEVQKSIEQAQSEQEAAVHVKGWRFPANYAVDPAEALMQVHETAHETNDATKKILEQLNKVLDRLRKDNNGTPSKNTVRTAEAIHETHRNANEALNMLEKVLQQLAKQ
jgi:hypothetical protein